MNLCPACNSENRMTSKFCRYCGIEILRKEEVPKSSITCPICNKINRHGTKFCPCGFNLQRIILRGQKTKIIKNVPFSLKEKDSSRYTKELEESLLFVENLKENFNLNTETLKGFVNYQQFLFEISEKGLAIIEKETGKFIAVNTEFEKITGYSREKIRKATFQELIQKLNPKNKKYNILAIQKKTKFSIFNDKNTKILLKFWHNTGLIKNNSTLIILEDIANTIFKKGKEFVMKKARSATKNLYLITRIVEEINSSLDIKIVLNNALAKVMAATRADIALIMFMKEDKTLFPIASRGVSKSLLENFKVHPIKTDRGSRIRALSLGKTVEAKIRKDEKKASMTGKLITKERLVSMVTVPLKSRDEVIGIMSLGRRKEEAFSGKELELLDSIGNHIAIAIKNSRLYTKVKEQLKELEEKNRRLKELEEMKEQLTRTIVHDLKSPLASIMSYADFVKAKKGISRQKLIEFFNAIHSSTQDTLRMVMNLLDISRMEDEIFNLTLSRINLEEITDKILNEIQIKMLKKELEAIKVIPDALPEVMGDRNIISRVITNLVDNAIKYSNSPGKIKIEITSPHKNELMFCIADEGRGIAEEHREKLFQSFFTIPVEDDDDTITTSTGIGLSFCKLAIEAHGGKIWMEENTPKGSKFYFTLNSDKKIVIEKD